jgi:hypothetical protein
LLVGIYENKELLFVARVKNGFVSRVREEVFPTKGAPSPEVSLQESAREKGVAVGRILDRRENRSMPMG